MSSKEVTCDRFPTDLDSPVAEPAPLYQCDCGAKHPNPYQSDYCHGEPTCMDRVCPECGYLCAQCGEWACEDHWLAGRVMCRWCLDIERDLPPMPEPW